MLDEQVTRTQHTSGRRTRYKNEKKNGFANEKIFSCFVSVKKSTFLKRKKTTKNKNDIIPFHHIASIRLF